MKGKYFFHWLLAVLLFSACGRGSKTASFLDEGGDTLDLRYAENLKIVSYDDYRVATLRNPWDTLEILHTYVLVGRDEPLPDSLPQGTVVRVPLQKAVIYSSVHCGLVEELGAQSAVGGVCDLRYIDLPYIKEGCRTGRIADLGSGMNPDIEKLMALHPDAVMLSPFENSGGYGRLDKLDIPIIECADYMETSSLGRAEWMRFYGLLFGVVSKADSLFAEVDSCYNQLRKRASLSSSSLSIVSELKSGSAWYVPGGCSTIGRLFNDACGRYAFAGDKHSGSIPLAFETVFDKAGDADVWTIKYNRDRDMTYSDLKADYIGYTGFKAFKTRNIYGCNTAKVPFYEETPFRPDYLLSDLIQILHPEIGDLGGLRYFCKLNE